MSGMKTRCLWTASLNKTIFRMIHQDLSRFYCNLLNVQDVSVKPKKNEINIKKKTMTFNLSDVLSRSIKLRRNCLNVLDVLEDQGFSSKIV